VYSLRTIVSGLLLIGCAFAFAAGLRQPWERRLSLEGHGHLVMCVAAASASGLVVTGSVDATARAWNAKSGKCVMVFKGHSHVVGSVQFSRDGSFLVTASLDGSARVWKTMTGECTARLIHGQPVVRAEFDPASDHVMTVTSVDGNVRIWDVAAEEAILTLRTDATVAALSPDGKCVVTGGPSGTVERWSIETGERQWTAQGHSACIHDVCFSPDGTVVASASADGTARLWGAMTGTPKCVLGSAPGKIFALDISPCGRRLVTGEERFARLWDTRTGRCLSVSGRQPSRVEDVAFMAEGDLVIGVGPGDDAWVRRPRFGTPNWRVLGRRETVGVLIFAALLIWSLWRDRKYFRALATARAGAQKASADGSAEST